LSFQTEHGFRYDKPFPTKLRGYLRDFEQRTISVDTIYSRKIHRHVVVVVVVVVVDVVVVVFVVVHVLVVLILFFSRPPLSIHLPVSLPSFSAARAAARRQQEYTVSKKSSHL